MLQHLLVLTLTLLAVCHGQQTAPRNPDDPNFKFAPILSMFASDEGTGSYEAALLKCRQGGGYLSADVTDLLHQAHVDTLKGHVGSGTWYAFMGGDSENTQQEYWTTSSAKDVCPYSQIQRNQTDNKVGKYIDSLQRSYNDNSCFYKWNQGRWKEIDDYLVANDRTWFYRSGVKFYRYRTQLTGDSSAQGDVFQKGYFPWSDTHKGASYVPNKDVLATDRPGINKGLYTVYVGPDGTWSDNEPTGGYTYGGIDQTKCGKSDTPFTCFLTADFSDFLPSIKETAGKFYALCDVQVSSRTMLEPYNVAESPSTENWWIIYLVVLICVGLLVFIILTICQEREDMDEPPEDAPEWALREATAVEKPKRYISQKSFRQVAKDEETEDVDE
ncbi:hypothetical protein AGDE_09526 [Angomonas deanei]|nr:hypothetical protein AGDE_09526 [Angomonas deanei]|eukprot:EPY30274.1 hypothetical protein AGDE_09526 [Angomonas deanei]